MEMKKKNRRLGKGENTKRVGEERVAGKVAAGGKKQREVKRGTSNKERGGRIKEEKQAGGNVSIKEGVGREVAGSI